MRPLALVVLAALLAGCGKSGDDPLVGPRDPTPPTPAGPPLVFGGVVVDVLTRETLANATVRLDLAQTRSCGRQGIGWASWEATVHENGSWGPLEVPLPRSDDVAFFLHVRAPEYAENTTFIGPQQVARGISDMTIEMHPRADVVGTAPAGTLVALEAPPAFPRVVLSAPNGTFAFRNARVLDAQLVAATPVPHREVVRAPANVTVPATEARGWLLEGVVQSETGAPMPADVIGWNGTTMWSVGRAGTNGIFTLPLPPERVELRIEARTFDDHYGGFAQLLVEGPPALRQPVLMRALC